MTEKDRTVNSAAGEKAEKGGHAALPAFKGIRPKRMVDAATAFRLTARLGLVRAVRGKILYASLALLAFPLAVQAIIMAVGQTVDAARFTALATLWINAVLPLAAILNGYGAVADEVEGRTLGYLFCRPVPRWSLPLGKALVPVVLVGPCACILVASGWALADHPPGLPRLLAAVLLASAYYSSAAVCAGALVPKHGVVASLGFVAFTDLALGNVPGFTQALSPGYHIRNLAGLLPPPTTMERFLPRPDVSVSTSALVVIVLSALLLLTTVVRLNIREYRTTP